ncbi:hypothetical protein FB451DRAFT_1295614 [Mycena latifolia]|nr:hypothetical protein FB451DRAFT_1295614 [Mycena latifolia]
MDDPVPSSDPSQLEGCQEDDEDEGGGPEDKEYSPLYIEAIRVIIQYVRSKCPSMISPVEDTMLQRFEVLPEHAQQLWICLLMRKDLKWHPIRRILKLGQRLGLEKRGVESVMVQLCVLRRLEREVCYRASFEAQRPTHRTEAWNFGSDESKMTNDEALVCLTVKQQKTIDPSNCARLKDELIATFKRDIPPSRLSEIALELLQKCIQINEDVGRCFGDFSGLLPAYVSNRIPEGSTPLLEVFNGIGKRFGLVTPRVWVTDLSEYAKLVEFELTLFPNPAAVKSAATDNHLLIFDGLIRILNCYSMLMVAFYPFV